VVPLAADKEKPVPFIDLGKMQVGNGLTTIKWRKMRGNRRLRNLYGSIANAIDYGSLRGCHVKRELNTLGPKVTASQGSK